MSSVCRGGNYCVYFSNFFLSRYLQLQIDYAIVEVLGEGLAGNLPSIAHTSTQVAMSTKIHCIKSLKMHKASRLAASTTYRTPKLVINPPNADRV